METIKSLFDITIKDNDGTLIVSERKKKLSEVDRIFRKVKVKFK